MSMSKEELQKNFNLLREVLKQATDCENTSHTEFKGGKGTHMLYDQIEIAFEHMFELFETNEWDLKEVFTKSANVNIDPFDAEPYFKQAIMSKKRKKEIVTNALKNIDSLKRAQAMENFDYKDWADKASLAL